MKTMTSTLPVNDADLACITAFAERIGDIIRSTWGHKECEDYLYKLMFDTRDGKRQGFPLPVASAIMVLHSRHQMLFKLAPKDKWENETRKTKDPSW